MQVDCILIYIFKLLSHFVVKSCHHCNADGLKLTQDILDINVSEISHFLKDCSGGKSNCFSLSD